MQCPKEVAAVQVGGKVAATQEGARAEMVVAAHHHTQGRVVTGPAPRVGRLAEGEEMHRLPGAASSAALAPPLYGPVGPLSGGISI